MDNKAVLLQLANFERREFPSIVLDGLVPMKEIVYHFPRFATQYINGSKDTGFREKDFSTERNTVMFRDSKPFYVLTCRFPFTVSRDYVGLCSGVHVVMSESLTNIHVFREDLQEELGPKGIKPYYRIVHMVEEGEFLAEYVRLELMEVKTEALVRNCAFWAFAYENGALS